MSSRGVVLLASERSGGNLLRAMLGGHSAISAPAPAGHVLRVLGPLLHLYADGAGALRIEELVEDAIALTRLHGQPWEIELTPGRVLGRLKFPTLWELFRVLYELHAEADDRPLWLAKDSRQFEYCYPLRRALPDAKFLYLYRDGRDVACSSLRSPAHEQHVYFCARRWRDDQAQCLRFSTDASAGRDVTLHVRYEDLIEQPEATLARICRFLGLSLESAMLAFHRGARVRAAAARADDWKNLSRPLLRDNRGKYRELLSAGKVRLFERLAGRELELLGYQRDFPAEPVVADVRFTERIRYEAIDLLRRRWKARRWNQREPFRRGRERSIAAIRRRLRSFRTAPPEPGR